MEACVRTNKGNKTTARMNSIPQQMLQAYLRATSDCPSKGSFTTIASVGTDFFVGMNVITNVQCGSSSGVTGRTEDHEIPLPFFRCGW